MVQISDTYEEVQLVEPQRIFYYREELTRKRCKTAILLYSFHTAWVYFTYLCSITFWALEHIFIEKRVLKNYTFSQTTFHAIFWSFIKCAELFLNKKHCRHCGVTEELSKMDEIFETTVNCLSLYINPCMLCIPNQHNIALQQVKYLGLKSDYQIFCKCNAERVSGLILL